MLKTLCSLRMSLGIGTAFGASRRRTIFGNVLLGDWNTSSGILSGVRYVFVVWIVGKMVNLEVIKLVVLDVSWVGVRRMALILSMDQREVSTTLIMTLALTI